MLLNKQGQKPPTFISWQRSFTGVHSNPWKITYLKWIFKQQKCLEKNMLTSFGQGVNEKYKLNQRGKTFRTRPQFWMVITKVMRRWSSQTECHKPFSKQICMFWKAYCAYWSMPFTTILQTQILGREYFKMFTSSVLNAQNDHTSKKNL